MASGLPIKDAMTTLGQGRELRSAVLNASDEMELFQALRLLDLAARALAGDQPPQRGVGFGTDAQPIHEAARLGATPRLSFAATEVAPRPKRGGRAPDIDVSAFGLTGPAGALPPAFTELLIQRRRQADPTLGSFLDLLNHRSISFLYRAWRKYRAALSFEAPGGHGEDAFSRMLVALIGLAGARLQDAATLSVEQLVGFAALFTRPTCSSALLENAIATLLGAPAQVDELIVRRLTVKPSEQTRLSSDWRFTPAYNQLGVDSLLGRQALDCQSTIQVRLGPLDYRLFNDLARPTQLRRALERFVRTAVGQTCEVRLQLVLKKDQTPPAVLGSPDGPRLGQALWARVEDLRKDPDDCVVHLA
jgi:type VI secretion system protein ImpH